jgi:uncharacterized membrane protein YjjP (DUF1212 family)
MSPFLPKNGDKDTQDVELLECMRKIGKALLATGSPVGVVENTLIEIAEAYQRSCEIVALPNTLMIKLGNTYTGGISDFSVQKQETIFLNRVSAISVLIDDVKARRIPPREASEAIDRILSMPPRFSAWMRTAGYVMATVGLTLRFRPEPLVLLIVAGLGLLVALMVEYFNKRPRYNLLLPVTAAILVSAIVFNLTGRGVINGTTNLIIPPLVIFLPGVILTTGMIDLGSMNLISGSSRVIYGVANLFLLFVGISIGFSISHLPIAQVYAYEAPVFSVFMPLIGTLLFGIGIFIRLSGSNRDLLWMLLVLYAAMFGQMLGERILNPYAGAFIGAAAMAFSSEYIGRSPQRTPAMVSQVMAFWFLVPGAIGLQSMTSLLTQDYRSAFVGLWEMVVLITSIALGVFLGTLVISPNKFILAKGYLEEPEPQKPSRFKFFQRK